MPHRFPDAVPVLLEVGHALPPVVDPVGLGVLLALPVGEPALAEHLADHVVGAKVHLHRKKDDSFPFCLKPR